MELTTTTIICLISLVLFFIYKAKKNGRTNIPGPKGYPIVGNTFSVDLKKSFLKLFEWSKTYGDIFQINILGKTFVVVSSSKIIRDLFLKEPNGTLTSARPETFLKNYIMPGPDVGFTSLDKNWVKRRKCMHKLLNAYGEGLQRIEKGIVDKLAGLKKDLNEINQQVCDPQDLVLDYVLCILQILLVGKYKEKGSDFHKFIIEFDDTANHMGNPGIDTLYQTFPFLRYVPLPSSKEYWKFVKLRDGLLKFLDKQSDGSDAGVYPAIKKLYESEKAVGESESWLTEPVMRALLQDFIGAAFLTTRGMLLSLIQILMAQPEVQWKVQEEVDRVIGHDRSPSLEDRSQMPYAEAVILETLRYTSHVPTSLLHATSQDVVIGEFTIPKGAVLVPNLWTTHHSEKEWKEPFKFKPERFLDENGDIFPADHEIRKQFMAFGVGKRSCIGEVFAKSRIFLFFTTLMQTCTVLPPEREIPTILNPRDMEPGLAMNPHPYKCKFVTRDVCQ